MDLQILYNNPRGRRRPLLKKRLGISSFRRRRNPEVAEMSKGRRIREEISEILERRKETGTKVKENTVARKKGRKAAGEKAEEAKKKVAKKATKKVAKKATKKVAKKATKKVAKKATKKVAKKAAKKVAKKAAKKVAKKAAKKVARKAAKKVARKGNPSKKKASRKASKKASKKVSRKAKKISRKALKRRAKKAAATRRRKAKEEAQKLRLIKSGYKKVNRKKQKALKRLLKNKHKMKTNPRRKKAKTMRRKKYKVRKNPMGAAMKKFEQVTKHDLKEASGLLAGGALIKIYDHHIKRRFITPALQPMLSKLGVGAQAVDALVDVLAATLIGQGLSFIGQKAKVKGFDVVGKGIIGASVVQLGIKSIASISTAAGMPMSGIIAVPEMNGIIAVPGMNGIIGVPQMGAYSADFGATGMTNADFGAYETVGLNGGLGQSYIQDADYGSGSVIPTAPRQPESLSLGAYENVEYSDESEYGDF